MKVTKSTKTTEEICSGTSTQQNLRYVKYIELDYKQYYHLLSDSKTYPTQNLTPKQAMSKS